MGKMQSLARSQEAMVCCEWLFCQTVWLSKGPDCEPVACWCVASPATWEIILRSNFAPERARIHSVVQKSRERFLPCQLVSTRHCLLLAPVRWKQWCIHVDPRTMLHFLLGNCCRAGEKEHWQLLQEHSSSLLLKCCRARFCHNSNKPFPVEFLSFFYTLF